MESYTYPVALTPDEDTVLVTFPDIPEAITFGDDEAEALAHAGEAIEAAIGGLIKDGRDVPAPSAAAGRPTVSLPATIAAKVALYGAMRENGITKAELARRLGWHRPQVGRLLDLNHGAWTTSSAPSPSSASASTSASATPPLSGAPTIS